jgi:hypothetical protein
MAGCSGAIEVSSELLFATSSNFRRSVAGDLTLLGWLTDLWGAAGLTSLGFNGMLAG